MGRVGRGLLERFRVNSLVMEKTSDAIGSHPTIFVIFGITGDLARRKLLPALLALYSKKLLPPRFSIVGVSRRSFSREEFREFIRSSLNIRPGDFKEEDIKHFLDHMSYEQGFFDQPALYNRLGEVFRSVDDKWKQCSNKLFHLSVPPTLYEGILKHISDAGLSKGCDDDMGWTRILIEKPFGSDSETARNLDKLLASLFKEEQIFRIDHYLAKEALQNIISFRFANSIFETMWNGDHIDKVHIKLFEKAGMEGRGAYYDLIGALKDVGQNHILMMMALVAMDMPDDLSALSIRKERSKVLSKIEPLSLAALKKTAVRGQYEGYQSEKGVSGASDTETYFRLEAKIDSPRWKNVPFYLESGKAFAESKTEIDIYFKSSKKSLYTEDGKAIAAKQIQKSKDVLGAPMENVLTFRIQPNEGIKIKFFVKTPGYEHVVEPKTLKFKYSDVLTFTEIPNDYERLIHDAFIGDQTLFASTPEIMASWKFVMSVVEKWKKLPLLVYKKGVKEIE